MKIKSIEIESIGGIKNLHIDFNERMNLICGPNGVGKTTLLECVAHSFSASNTTILKRNASSDGGHFQSIIDIDGEDKQSNITISDFAPRKQSSINGLHTFANKLLSLKVNRTFSYQALDAVSMDVEKNEHHMYQEAKLGVRINEVKNWFVNRFLYSAHKGALTDIQLHNLNLAKSSFSLLNPDFSFSTVKAASNEIMINTPNGEIYYEYLSSGFKSCLSIIFGIIKDIEFRFKEPGIKADEFDGIILIDELELHLHPEWQAKIAQILTNVFPKAQFITATHSPHVLQSAQPKEIIALAFNEENEVYRRELGESSFGFQGWSVEEILVDVMGMTDTRTEPYHHEIQLFEQAIQNENFELADASYKKLDKLLHPQNYFRKVLKLELEAIRTLSK